MKHYIEKSMKVQHSEYEPIYFDHYDPEALHDILETQRKMTENMKQKGEISFFKS